MMSLRSMVDEIDPVTMLRVSIERLDTGLE